MTLIGGSVGVGVGDGLSVGPAGDGDGHGVDEAHGDTDGDGEMSGCAKGEGVGSGVDCAETETAPHMAAPQRSTTSKCFLQTQGQAIFAASARDTAVARSVL